MVSRSELALKRVFDSSMSFVIILLLAPFFLILALAILLNDRGPIFFTQKRIGRGGKSFLVYKFRCIRVSAAPVDGLFGSGDLSKVSVVGKFLRRTKLNEMPQLINVLIGDMSFVGPRPEVEKWVAVYPERWALVLKVKPGITDLASIVYWNEEDILSGSVDPEKTYREIVLPKKLDICEDYIANYSFSGDMKIIFATIAAFLTKNGLFRCKKKKYAVLEKAGWGRVA